MNPEQIRAVANALCAIIEASDCDFDTVAECLEGIVFSAEELGEIREYMANF